MELKHFLISLVFILLLGCSDDSPDPIPNANQCSITSTTIVGTYKVTSVMKYDNGIGISDNSSDVACFLNGVFTFLNNNAITYSGNVWNTGGGPNCIPVTNIDGTWYLASNGILEIEDLLDGYGYALKTNAGFEWLSGNTVVTFIRQ